MNPYLVLGVPQNADDATIRRAYLDGIKLASPDSNPKRFQALSQAYEKIKDEGSRLRYFLFHTDCPAESPLDALRQHARMLRPIDPIPFDRFKEFVRSLADERKP